MDPTNPTQPDTTPEDLAQLLSEHHAQALKEISTGAYLYASMGALVGLAHSPDAFPAYIAKLLQDCGDPEDPIERMLIEQLALAHHNIGRLHAKSGLADDSDVAVAYAGAATRLLAEFRRCSLALEDYRAKQTDRAGGDEVGGVDQGRVDVGRSVSMSVASRNGSNGKPAMNGSNGKPQEKEIPRCLKDRMARTPGVSKRVA